MSISNEGGEISQNSPSPQDLKEMGQREALANMPVEWIEKLRDAGKDGTIEDVESTLQEESEKILTEEIGLSGYLPPDRFILPRSDNNDLKSSNIQEFFNGGPENGVFISGMNAVFISTDYGHLNGLIENNLLSTSVHELVHNDTYNRLTDSEDVVNPDYLNAEIEDIWLPGQRLEDIEIDLENDYSILYDLNREYKISDYELGGLSEEARDKISELSTEYNNVESSERPEILDEAFDVVDEDIEVYHLLSAEVEPELESFAWLVSMYVEDDLEGTREHLEREFSGYKKGNQIKSQLEELVDVYDNLTEHSQMNQEEAVNYILEEVQPRKFEYKAGEIRENL